MTFKLLQLFALGALLSFSLEDPFGQDKPLILNDIPLTANGWQCFDKLSKAKQVEQCRTEARTHFNLDPKLNIDVLLNRTCEAIFYAVECLNKNASKYCTKDEVEQMADYREIELQESIKTICPQMTGYNIR